MDWVFLNKEKKEALAALRLQQDNEGAQIINNHFQFIIQHILGWCYFFLSTSHIQSDVAFLNHQISLLLQIILHANHNTEPPASNNAYIIYRFPGCFWLSRLYAEAQEAKLSYVPDGCSFFFGLGNKSLTNFCCLSLHFLRSLQRLKFLF